MVYGTEPDYSTLERDAWHRGDTYLADVYARALEAETLEAAQSEAQYKLDRIEAIITEANWRTGKKAELREMGDRIYQELKGDA